MLLDLELLEPFINEVLPSYLEYYMSLNRPCELEDGPERWKEINCLLFNSERIISLTAIVISIFSISKNIVSTMLHLSMQVSLD